MKKSIVAAILVLLAASTTNFYACKHKQKGDYPDLATGISSRYSDAHIMFNQGAILDTLKKFDSLGQVEEFIHLNWPNLKKDVKDYQVRLGNVHDTDVVDSSKFFLGSEDSAIAEDGKKKLHHGYIKNELVVAYYLNGNPKPVYFIVRCGNGYSYPPGHEPTGLKLLNIKDSTFVIDHHNDALENHMSHEQSMELGRKYDLPVYVIMRKNGKENHLPAPKNKKLRKKFNKYDEAERLYKNHDASKVVIPVCLLDSINVTEMTFTRPHG